MPAMNHPCRQVGVLQVRPRSKPRSSSPIQDNSSPQCHGLLIKFTCLTLRLRKSSMWVSLLPSNTRMYSLGMWRRRETLKWQISFLKNTKYINLTNIPDVCNASSEWILLRFAFTMATECWIQCSSGNARRLLSFRLIFCSFLKPLRKCLLNRDMLLFATCNSTRQHFNEHSCGSDFRLLSYKLSNDISPTPQKAPTSMRSKPIIARRSSYNIIKSYAEVSHHFSFMCKWLIAS